MNCDPSIQYSPLVCMQTSDASKNSGPRVRVAVRQASKIATHRAQTKHNEDLQIVLGCVRTVGQNTRRTCRPGDLLVTQIITTSRSSEAYRDVSGIRRRTASRS